MQADAWGPRANRQEGRAESREEMIRIIRIEAMLRMEDPMTSI
jgi:hypothetical protein